MAWTPTHTSAAGSLMIAPQFLPVFRDYTRRPLASFLQSVLFSSTHYSFHATLPFHQFPPFQVLHQFLKKLFKIHEVVGMGHISQLPHLPPSTVFFLPSQEHTLDLPTVNSQPPHPHCMLGLRGSENVTDPQGENLAKRS